MHARPPQPRRRQPHAPHHGAFKEGTTSSATLEYKPVVQTCYEPTELHTMTVVVMFEAGDPPIPCPDGAVMVTLKIARFNPEAGRERRHR